MNAAFSGIIRILFLFAAESARMLSVPGSSPFAAPLPYRLSVPAALLWTLVLAASLAWNLNNARRQAMDMAYAEARANLNKDISLRRWGTEHGGVYVPITDTQKSVPWLDHVPGRDVEAADGRRLTLLNPASMLRQMMDRYAEQYGIRGRIIGLRQLNPANAPDAWEREQLEAFTRGEKGEVWSIAELDGQPYLRYLRAMFMEPGCDKCHAILGYRTGDMRGATGLNLPLAPYYRQIDASRLNLGISHGAIWLLGLGGIVWAWRQLNRRDRERKEAAERLHLYANVFQHSGEAILVTDRDNRIVAINQALTRYTGFTLEELYGENPRVLASGHTPPETYQELWAALKATGFWQGELWDRRKDGGAYPKWTAISLIRNEAGAVTHHIASFTDISERKTAEARIDYLARHDALTGLYNRYNLEGRLAQALLQARRTGAQVALMFIDMDRFKVINDTLGHHVGDRLLIEVARRLEGCVRESDIIARLGGDEFVVVLTGMEAGLDAAPVAGKILQALAGDYEVGGNTLHSAASIGISVFPADGEDGETLMKHADTAMYHAKEQGRNNFQFFTASMNEVAGERMLLERDLHAALLEGQFEVHYQPQVDGRDGKLRGVEALVRWRHPQRGMIPPLKFIPVAEEAGMIEALGAWVLDEACRQLAAWRAEGVGGGLRMAVNLSAHQLRSPELPGQVAATIARHGLQSGDLELEVTESVAMADPARAIDRLQALRALGVDLAIDDFGTGYSSLAYLKLLPIQTLKLDRAFVCDIETDANDAAISAASLALAHSLGLRVVAEGVETAGQRDFLVAQRCDILQGYLFGRPQPAAYWSANWCSGAAETAEA
ncbi:MAG: signal transduction protein [Candidatus Accumulibacter sp.]|nr:signal transduction protein [Accumulibacter sp.]